MTLLFAGLGWISFVCLIAGIILVIIEMFIPGFGLPGILGTILLVVGTLLLAKTAVQALIIMVIILAILGVALVIVLQSASKGLLSRHLVLQDRMEGEIRFSAADDLNYFVGNEGRALTALRPSGSADFDGVKLDVVSDGEFIPKDSIVVINKIEGRRILVRQKPSGDT